MSLQKEAPIQLGDRARCRITKVAGVATCISNWLNGCRRVSIQPETLDKEGKPMELITFDEEQLEIIKRGVVAPKVLVAVAPPPQPARPRGTGGPARESKSFRRF